MAVLPWAANTDENQETLDDYSPIPTGKYNAEIIRSEMKPTKAGDGEYLQLNIKIIDGPYADRMVFDRLNLDNPNARAVEIANKTLNTICQACDMVGVEDSEELHGIPLTIKVKLKPETDAYPASNDINFYGPYEGEFTEETVDFEEETEVQSTPPKAKPKPKPKAKPVVKAKPKAKPVAKKAAAKKLPWEK